MKKKKKKHKENKTKKGRIPFFFLFPAPPTFCAPFTFASSPLSESLEQANWDTCAAVYKSSSNNQLSGWNGPNGTRRNGRKPLILGEKLCTALRSSWLCKFPPLLSPLVLEAQGFIFRIHHETPTTVYTILYQNCTRQAQTHGKVSLTLRFHWKMFFLCWRNYCH